MSAHGVSARFACFVLNSAICHSSASGRWHCCPRSHVEKQQLRGQVAPVGPLCPQPPPEGRSAEDRTWEGDTRQLGCRACFVRLLWACVATRNRV